MCGPSLRAVAARVKSDCAPLRADLALMVCCCNLVMGMCKCEMTDKGVTITCTSGDQKCGEMIQSCCDYMATMCKSGCTCCVMMNNTPVCCGC